MISINAATYFLCPVALVLATSAAWLGNPLFVVSFVGFAITYAILAGKR